MRTVALGEVASIIMGQAPPGSSYNDEGVGTPLIAGAGDFPRGRLKPTKYTTSATKLSEPGDIILSIRASIGSKVWADGKYCLGRGVAGLRASEGILAEYLWHWLTYHERVLAAKGRGATFPQVSRSDIADLTIRLPSIEVQRRIATTLDQADALRAKRRRSLALLDHLGSSIFGFLYGDPTTPHPTTRPLAEVARLQIGPFGSLLHKSDYTVAGIPLINPMHIVDGELRPDPRHSVSEAKASELEIYRLRRGDVVMGRRGEMGRCAIVTASQEGMLCGTGSLIVRPDLNSVTSQYLQAVLSHASVKRQLERQALGATLPNLNAGIVNAVRMRVPPLSEQAYLEEVADSISRKTSVARRSLATLDEFFTSLQSRAFSGGLTLSAS